ncbi:hypothetical protein [Roseomonas indoligenes]|uniref:Uncharacterized protein n=1 Tax=Roseomonas indoligenes TaxID=2820811 RepID=A0A940MTS4_9PROT|nr:hypothetical protein [Pararoseomonas indoligenes]MBP0493983.1 hypothetical protein [Pararoseomonas indoligenes]
MPIVNKRELAAAAGIAKATLDAKLAEDPDFPVLRRGIGRGDGWQFDREEALARLAELMPSREEFSRTQQFMALRVLRMERQTAVEVGALLPAEEARTALVRALTGFRRSMTNDLPVEAGKLLGLSREQQRKLRAMTEDALRAFVAGLHASGLPDAS